MADFIYTSTTGSYLYLLNALHNTGEQVRVGDEDTVEFSPFAAHFSVPQLNIIDPPGRNLNLAYGIVELLDILYDDNPGMAPWFNSKLNDYMLNKKLPGHYGERMNCLVQKTPSFIRNYFEPGYPSQIGRCLKELQIHPNSRRAVITIHNPMLENYISQDVACTLNLQFILRDGYLDLICYMRSNDALWGYCYDTFHWTTLQMLMASMLTAVGTKAEPGMYHHIAGSFHYYKQRHKQINNILECANVEYEVGNMLTIPVAHPQDIRGWLDYLRKIAKSGIDNKLTVDSFNYELPEWVRMSALSIAAYCARRHKQKELCDDILAISKVSSSQHAIWINHWLSK